MLRELICSKHDRRDCSQARAVIRGVLALVQAREAQMLMDSRANIESTAETQQRRRRNLPSSASPEMERKLKVNLHR